jgi:hypothetical protein
MCPQIPALGLAIGLTVGVVASVSAARAATLPDQAFIPAHAVASAAGTSDVVAEERARRRFPQAARVGDLIGLPMLDDNARTLGYVRQIVRTPQNRIELIVSYNGWLG